MSSNETTKYSSIFTTFKNNSWKYLSCKINLFYLNNNLFIFFFFQIKTIKKFPSLFETFSSSSEDTQPLLKQTSNYLNQQEQRPPFIDLVNFIFIF